LLNPPVDFLEATVWVSVLDPPYSYGFRRVDVAILRRIPVGRRRVKLRRLCFSISPRHLIC